MAIKGVLMTVVLLSLSLYFWRELYPVSDAAAFILALFAVILFFGAYRPAIGMHRAKIKAAVISGTELSTLLSGRLLTAILSAIFTLVAVTVLAWQALTIGREEAAALLALCITASGLSLWIKSRLAGSLHPPFAHSMGMGFGYGMAAFVFIPILMWINYEFVPHPGHIRTSGLAEAMLRATEELPERGGLITGLLSVLYAIDAAKIWFAVRLSGKAGSAFWISMLYCLDAALVAFAVAKSSAAITDLFTTPSNKGQ